MIEVKYCLKEWETGACITGPDFSEKAYKDVFTDILDDIEDLANSNPEFFRHHGQKLFRRAK
jgi:hypothetical protein